MKPKRKKRAPVYADQTIQDQNAQNASEAPLGRELFQNQIESIPTITRRDEAPDVTDQKRARLSAGDPDVSRQGIDTGEETPGGSTPTLDQDSVDEIGEAVGVTYQDYEPLIFDEKYGKRDETRWEDDPASSEDYVERQAALKSESERLRPGNRSKN